MVCSRSLCLTITASALGLPEEMIVSTRNPCSFLSFFWNGDVKGASLLADISFILDATDSKHFIESCVITRCSYYSNILYI
jgi:hypothetical protein